MGSQIDGDKAGQQKAAPPPLAETDDFGLPIRRFPSPKPETKEDGDSDDSGDGSKWADAEENVHKNADEGSGSHESKDKVSDANNTPKEPVKEDDKNDKPSPTSEKPELAKLDTAQASESKNPTTPKPQDTANEPKTPKASEEVKTTDNIGEKAEEVKLTDINDIDHDRKAVKDELKSPTSPTSPTKAERGHHKNMTSISSIGNEPGVSEFSHQQLMHPDDDGKDEADEWQTMPSYARYDMYDDDDKLIAREYHGEQDDETYAYGGLGGAGKGYTRVTMDDDAQSANSMDDNTQYLFKDGARGTAMVDEDDEARDMVSQMQATKDLLTEGQRIAYVGVVRLEIANMVDESSKLEAPRKIKKQVNMSHESMKMWGQKMMIRLYAHMDISEAEQIMIEQLAEHGVVPSDLVPALHANARVKNPMAGHVEEEEDEEEEKKGEAGSKASSPIGSVDGKLDAESSDQKEPTSPVQATSPDVKGAETATSEDKTDEEKTIDKKTPDEDAADGRKSQEEKPTEKTLDEKTDGEKASEGKASDEKSSGRLPDFEDEEPAEPPPPYEAQESAEVPELQAPSDMPSTEKIDIDLRWTVLCDLFLILIADSIYDARSRLLLERFGQSLDVNWIDVRRFEKRVTDALEMQQQAEKENWNEDEHMESRRKMALKKRYMMLGLATVGGGLVIGLSAGLLAPMIGAGLAAGFSTIGVAGTSSFLGGVGGAAVITSGAVTTGSIIGHRAADRRTGAVQTFEYRPLHNNKRVNLIVTVSGWLTGKVDDVRLPFSTVDPIMGDIYSVLWEPDMLRSMGDTIRILATEALTQSIQQVLGGTILTALMGALQLPIILTKLSYLIDNPWAVSLDRATAAGKILADSLIERSLGTRPVTLVGYSLGSRVIFSALLELSKRGAYGLVQNVYLFGSPVVYKKEEYLRARTVVPGRFLNGYNKTDWILGYLFRLTNGGVRRVAGLGPIEELPWIENMDCTEFVKGHMEYRTAMPILLRHSGWMVESDEFTEIEDPDPENHDQRQRELINEIEEARKKLEEEGKAETKSKKFSFFGRRKKAEKQEWELYEDTTKDSEGKRKQSTDDAYRGALFDVDAIRAEVAKEKLYGDGGDDQEIQIKEIKSTLPPMKLDLGTSSASATPTPTAPAAPHSSLKETRSADNVHMYHPEEDGIQMTFDTSFDEPKRAASYQGVRDEQPSHSANKPSQAPPPMLDNPWGDPDDEDFGKEKEISMTFA